MTIIICEWSGENYFPKMKRRIMSSICIFVFTFIKDLFYGSSFEIRLDGNCE